MAATNPGSIEAAAAVSTVTTADLASPAATPQGSPGVSDPLYPDGVPQPKGTEPAEENRQAEGKPTDPMGGTGIEGETIVWEARYSLRNFIGRTAARGFLTACWLILAYYTWGMNHEGWAIFTWLTGAAVALAWLTMIVRVLQARFSHFYRLTNLRLFVSTGIVNRRRDMMELLRVKDVFTQQQSLLDRWLGLGTVVVVPDEKILPTFYVVGVDDPKEVMDLIWHHARSERDQRSVKVDSV